MNIGKARQLKVGQVVSCPADRGAKAYNGRIRHISDGAAQNIYGEHYLWVTVEKDRGRNEVWPSNRLG